MEEKLSDCCNATIIHEDICSDCKEHCDAEDYRVEGLDHATGVTEAFATFAELHPEEAYDLDSKMFCTFFRTKMQIFSTDEEIARFIAQCKGDK